MKKIIFILIIFFVSFITTFANIIDEALVEYEKWNIEKSKDILCPYMHTNTWLFDCNWYFLLSKIEYEDSKLKSDLYKELEQVCKNIIWWESDVSDDINFLINQNNWNLRTFYIFLYKIILVEDIKINNLEDKIISLFKIENEIINRDWVIIYDFYKDLHLLLLDLYIKDNNTLKYFENLNNIWTYLWLVNNFKFWKTFSFIREEREIEKYKDYIVNIYWEEFYNFIFSYTKLRFWFKWEYELSNDIINKYKEIVLIYYKNNQIEIDKKILNYNFEKDFFNAIDQKLWKQTTNFNMIYIIFFIFIFITIIFKFIIFYNKFKLKK